MLVSKLDVDDVISWLRGAVGDLTGAVLLVLSVNVHFTGAFNGQAQATIACRIDRGGEGAQGRAAQPSRRSHVPASRVSMTNSAGSKVLASLRPGPLT